MRIALVGGGVIGGGWAARFTLHGHDVVVHDPAPGASDTIRRIVDEAAGPVGELRTALPERGHLTFARETEEAVEHADLIQESVPERIELKQKVHMAIDAAAPADALIGSSTSGLLPTDIQAKMMTPERMFVAHPYNPVYLLPLVELVAGRATAPETLARAADLYRSVSMHPVIIRKEIDAFVGDRLLEAVWREALWLVKDDVCTVAELDDIITHSFGLRWAQMGLFQTYVLGGGEGGMRHFLAQFAPTLSLPWSKLTDVPDLDEDLQEKIAAQCDEASAGMSPAELSKQRDENLVAILRALGTVNGGRGWGAGRIVGDVK